MKRLAAPARRAIATANRRFFLRLHALPALDSNYFWLLQPDDGQPGAYIFDPGDAAPVETALQKLGLRLEGIIITHHHWDHTDGIDDLLARHDCPVFGPRSERIPQVTEPLSDGDRLSVGPLTLTVIAMPGHTLDHIGYYLDGDTPRLFCADTVFACGCGRMFEGTPEQFLASLDRIAALPSQTLLYCSHEYTLKNIDFALAVEPGNSALRARRERETERRERGEPTLPTRLDEELATNPFLRTAEPAVAQAASDHEGRALSGRESVFASLRRWKDQF